MKTAVFLGDSLTAGGGSPFVDSAHTYCNTTGALLGWTVVNKGEGGCGYLHPGNSSGLTYAGRVDADVIALTPDVVVVQGGTNDMSYDIPTVVAAAGSLLARIKAGLPNAELYVLGLFYPMIGCWPGWDEGAIWQFSLAMPAVVKPYGLWIDPVVQQWLTETDAPIAWPGNSAVYRGTDGTHPTQAGHNYMGTKLAFAISPPSTGLAGGF
jgi:lysophospholipase L1-like esterase